MLEYNQRLHISRYDIHNPIEDMNKILDKLYIILILRSLHLDFDRII